MSLPTPFCARLLVAWLLLLQPMAARAESTDDSARAKARELGALALKAYRAEDYVSAQQKLDEAYRLLAVPTLGLWSARAMIHNGRWVEATERYRETIQDSHVAGDVTAQRQAQADAEHELAQLQARIPSLTVNLAGLEPTSVRIAVDGETIAADALDHRYFVNPGTHHVEAVHGDERYQSDVELAENQHKLVPIVFQSTTTLPPSAADDELAAAPQSTRGSEHTAAGVPNAVLLPSVIAAVSLGVAGLTTWAVTGIVAKNKCPGGSCPSTSVKADYDSLRTVSSVTFYLGGALLVGGIASWFLVPHAASDHEPRWSWGLGPTGGYVHGAF